MNHRGENDSAHPIFSKYTVGVLQNAGWCPNRRVRIDNHIRMLKADGYKVFPTIRDFLEQFGNLEIHYEFELESGDKETIQDIIHFDASYAASAVYPERIAEYMRFLGLPLCVIGECNSRHTTLLMDSQGKVYGGQDDLIIFCGETGEQAIENLISMKNIRRLRK
jgi:hypothetical protein